MSYYERVLSELKRLSIERSLTFAPSTRSGFEWILQIEVNPGKRSFFSIEGENSGEIRIVVVPAVGREYSNRAWNRIETPQRDKLQRLEWNGYEGKQVALLRLRCFRFGKMKVHLS